MRVSPTKHIVPVIRLVGGWLSPQSPLNEVLNVRIRRRTGTGTGDDDIRQRTAIAVKRGIHQQRIGRRRGTGVEQRAVLSVLNHSAFDGHPQNVSGNIGSEVPDRPSSFV